MLADFEKFYDILLPKVKNVTLFKARFGTDEGFRIRLCFLCSPPNFGTSQGGFAANQTWLACYNLPDLDQSLLVETW